MQGARRSMWLGRCGSRADSSRSWLLLLLVFALPTVSTPADASEAGGLHKSLLKRRSMLFGAAGSAASERAVRCESFVSVRSLEMSKLQCPPDFGGQVRLSKGEGRIPPGRATP